jgi:hypothetical protein
LGQIFHPTHVGHREAVFFRGCDCSCGNGVGIGIGIGIGSSSVGCGGGFFAKDLGVEVGRM